MEIFQSKKYFTCSIKSHFKINARVCIFFLPVHVGKWVELTLTECKLDGFLVISV